MNIRFFQRATGKAGDASIDDIKAEIDRASLARTQARLRLDDVEAALADRGALPNEDIYQEYKARKETLADTVDFYDERIKGFQGDLVEAKQREAVAAAEAATAVFEKRHKRDFDKALQAVEDAKAHTGARVLDVQSFFGECADVNQLRQAAGLKPIKDPAERRSKDSGFKPAREETVETWGRYDRDGNFHSSCVVLGDDGKPTDRTIVLGKVRHTVQGEFIPSESWNSPCNDVPPAWIPKK